MTVTLKHPAFGERVTREVEPDEVARWVASGWLDDRPEHDGPVPRPEPEPVEGVRILPVDPPKPAPRRKKPPRSATT